MAGHVVEMGVIKIFEDQKVVLKRGRTGLTHLPYRNTGSTLVATVSPSSESFVGDEHTPARRRKTDSVGRRYSELIHYTDVDICLELRGCFFQVTVKGEKGQARKLPVRNDTPVPLRVYGNISGIVEPVVATAAGPNHPRIRNLFQPAAHLDCAEGLAVFTERNEDLIPLRERGTVGVLQHTGIVHEFANSDSRKRACLGPEIENTYAGVT